MTRPTSNRRGRARASLAATFVLAGGAALALRPGPEPNAATPPPVRPLASAPPQVSGTFPTAWIDGSQCPGPEFQIHAYEPNLYILRQNFCENFEAPFLYLIFGDEKVLMLDTGASPNTDVRGAVDGVIDDWLIQTGLPDIELIVAHTHGHGDHVQGDAQFQNRPNTTIVNTGANSVIAFFGLSPWPKTQATYDLGNRVLDVIGTPGHAKDGITFYDRQTQLLLTGDTVYPGRLYVFGANTGGSWQVFRNSIQRLVDFAAVNPVTWVAGCHIEMSATPGIDFAYGTTYHPNEHVLELPPTVLPEILSLMAGTGTQGVPLVHPDLIVSPVY